MDDGSDALGGRCEQDVLDDRPRRAIVHEAEHVVLTLVVILAPEIRQHETGRLLDHRALARISHAEHVLLRRFAVLRLLVTAWIRLHAGCELHDPILVRHRDKMPLALMVRRRCFEAGHEDAFEHVLRDRAILELADAAALFDDVIKFHGGAPFVVASSCLMLYLSIH